LREQHSPGSIFLGGFGQRRMSPDRRT